MKKTCSPLHQRRVAGERPDFEQVPAKAMAQGIAERVTEERTGSGRDPYRDHLDHAKTNQGAHAKQDHDTGQQNSDQHQ